MDDFLYTLTVMVLGGGALLWSIRGHGFILHVHGFCIYNMGAIFVLYLSKIGIVNYPYLLIWSNFKFITYYYQSVAMFAGFSIFYLFALVGLGKKPAGSTASLNLTISPRAYWIIIIGLLICAVSLLNVLDLDALWLNSEYLLINTPKGLNNHSTLSLLLLSTDRLRGILGIALFAYLCAQKKWFAAFVLMPAIAFSLLFYLAAHSRTPVLYLGEFGLLYFVMNGRYRTSILISSFFLALFASVIALIGRNSGAHGLAAILPRYWQLPPNMILGGALPNLFEGIYVTTEIFGRQDRFDFMYKLLSFSPFPSAIDGFSSIRDIFQIRLHRYVPMSAVLETYAFGPLFWLLNGLVQFITVREVAKSIIVKNTMISLALSFLVLFTLYLQYAYPVRHMFRFMILALVLTLLSKYKFRLSKPLRWA